MSFISAKILERIISLPAEELSWDQMLIAKLTHGNEKFIQTGKR